MTSSVTAQDVLGFWFQGDPDIWRTDPWFRKSDAFDATIRDRFALAVTAAQDGVLDGWTATPDGTLDNGRLRLAMNGARPGSVFRFSDVQLYELAPEPEPEPEPVEPRRIVQVITPRLEPGDVLEVYCARPERLVIEDGDINFEATPWAFHTRYLYEADQNN